MDEMNTTAEAEPGQGNRRRKARRRDGPQQSGGPVYGLGMIGALVYFAAKAESWQDYLLAVGKAMVWPALLVYQAFRRFGG